MSDHEDILYFMERANNQAGTNQLVVVLNGQCCKVERENYYPDENGCVEFHKKTEWSEPGFSIAEILEFLQKYLDKITKISFEAIDGNQYAPVNVYESDSLGDVFTYSCFILVGDPDAPLELYGNPQNENWMTDNLGRNRTFNPKQF